MRDKINSLQIVRLCIGFMGIQLGFALQAGNITRILQNYGADVSEIAFFWLLAPITGTIIQPLAGYLSDKWINLGKTRVPFLLTGGILSTVALLALPNAAIFVAFISPLLFGALIIFVIDVAFNISIHPLRATIPDYLPKEQQSKGFTIQTFLISIGAIIGSSLPYILHTYFKLSTITTSNQIADNVKWSFYFGGIVVFLCMLLTIQTIRKSKLQITDNVVKQKSSTKSFFTPVQIPSAMWKIGVIQFFSWASFFLIWVYMTPAIAQHYYEEYNHLPSSIAYAEAANYTGVLFAYHHISASILALLLPFIFKKIRLINCHSLALLFGSIGLLWVYLSNDINNLVLPMLMLGIAWASILSTPFILLSQHIPQNKIGLYFGLFNLFITVPQIIVGMGSGFLIANSFGNKAISAILMAAISLFIAAIIGQVFRSSFTVQKKMPG